MLKKHALIIAVCYALALATVSLIKINDLPNAGIPFADKIFHFLAYSVLVFLWGNAFFFKFKYKKSKAMLYAAVLSIILGIIIEVLQGSITTSRHTDVYDAIANTLGVIITVLIVLINKKMYIKF